MAQTIEFELKSDATKRAKLMKESDKYLSQSIKVKKTLNNKYVVLFQLVQY